CRGPRAAAAPRGCGSRRFSCWRPWLVSPNGGTAAQRTTRYVQGHDSYLAVADTSRQFPEKDGSFFRAAAARAGGTWRPQNLGLSAGKPLSLPHPPCSVGWGLTVSPEIQRPRPQGRYAMNLADEIAALARQTVPELRERYAAL